jgi:hypothetical protein
MKRSWLLLFREVIAVLLVKIIQNINKLCRQNLKFLSVKARCSLTYGRKNDVFNWSGLGNIFVGNLRWRLDLCK